MIPSGARRRVMAGVSNPAAQLHVDTLGCAGSGSEDDWFLGVGIAWAASSSSFGCGWAKWQSRALTGGRSRNVGGEVLPALSKLRASPLAVGPFATQVESSPANHFTESSLS
jgi:hypothetical protein